MFQIHRAALLLGLLVLTPTVGWTGGNKSGVVVDKAKRTVTIDAKIANRKLEHLKGEIYPIEVIACWAHPKGKKAHETVVTIEGLAQCGSQGAGKIGPQARHPAPGRYQGGTGRSGV